MKILLIELNGADPDILFKDERLEIIRRLMSLGCFGLLQSPPPSKLPPDYIAKVVAEQGKNVIVVDTPPLAGASERVFNNSQPQFEHAKQAMQSPTWEYLHIICTLLLSLPRDSSLDSELISSLYLQLDAQVGNLLELLDDKTLLVLLSCYGIQRTEGCFVIAAPNNPLRGELHNLQLLDIAPTILELAGYELPPGLPGQSLVANFELDDFSSAELTEEEEAILRERLSGLGYI